MLFLGSLQSPPLRLRGVRGEVPMGRTHPLYPPGSLLLMPRFKDEHLPAKVEIRNVRLQSMEEVEWLKVVEMKGK